VAETALVRRYRLSRELRELRHSENAQGVNPTTGKRAKRTKESEQVTTDTTIEPTESNFFEFEPDVYYDAIVDSITEVPNNFPDARTATQLQWEFRVDSEHNEDGTVATKRGWSSFIWNPRAKTYKWALAILGAVDKDAAFRTSMVIGKPCRIVLVSGVNDQGQPGTSLNVVGPTKATASAKPAAKKAGLVSSLKAEQPENIASIGACVLCGEPGTAYTGKGQPICDGCK
jgi:hypothetical protein